MIGEVHEGQEGLQSSRFNLSKGQNVRSQVSQVTLSGSTILHQTAWIFRPTNALVYGSMTMTTFDNVFPPLQECLRSGF